MACKMDDHLMVVAIDLGTTFSGFAFSTRDGFVRDPENITTKLWNNPIRSTLMPAKTSTSILFKPDKTFHSFGFDADIKYMDLADEDEHGDWYYFSRFKMMLYKQLVINDSVELKSFDAKTLPAMLVFSESIRYLKDEVLNICEKTFRKFSTSEILWVLTLPATLTDAAKGFMRTAAEKAGIPKHRLITCLEPEAAAIYIKHIPQERIVQKCSGDTLQIFTPGSKYLVCDAGGGTIDFTAHEVKDDGSMKEISSATGGNWGGTKVDEAFQFVLKEVFGDHVMKKLIEENKYDNFEILSIFEEKKRMVSPEKGLPIFIRIPYSLHEAFEDLNQGENTTTVKGSDDQPQHECRSSAESELTLQRALKDRDQHITVRRGKIRLNSTVWQLLFKETNDSICDQLHQIFKRREMQHVDTILVVGGYADSPMLQHCIKTAFPRKRLIIPEQASLSVLKGAVMYGHTQALVQEIVPMH